MTKSINVLVGSLRKASFHKIIAENYPKIAPHVNFTIFEELNKIPYYNADIHAEGVPVEVLTLSESIKNADAVILLTPEYNYSFPAVLKNALDWVSRLPDTPFAKKKVGIQSGSMGPGGGSRVQYHLRQVLVFLDAQVINKPEVFFYGFGAHIDVAKREITNDAYKNLIKLQIEKLLE